MVPFVKIGSEVESLKEKGNMQHGSFVLEINLTFNEQVRLDKPKKMIYI
jgi:hypothetical protein